ncbi:MAG TPA: hypothetical protein VLD19_13140, partial [Chitinophagaceae bacterium]|nr:hypothetical protein [Chitinophagaceae bacterium]
PRPVFPVLLGTDVFDNAFQQYYLDTIRVVDSSVYRNIKMNFKYSSPFSSFILTYDTIGYHVRNYYYAYYKYRMRNRIQVPPPGTYTITQPTVDYREFSGYIYFDVGGIVPAHPFNTGKYFRRSGRNFIPIAPYANYQIINQLFNP